MPIPLFKVGSAQTCEAGVPPRFLVRGVRSQQVHGSREHQHTLTAHERRIGALVVAATIACFGCGRVGYEPAPGARVDATATARCADFCPFACVGEVCQCTGDTCGQRIVCAPGVPCMIDCVGENACVGGVSCGDATSCVVNCQSQSSCASGVSCDNAATCDVTCSALGACGSGVTCDSAAECNVTCTGAFSCGAVVCGTGACNVQCTHQDACPGGINCSQACACDATCSGNICMAQCPYGTACAGNESCTSAPTGCDVCR